MSAARPHHLHLHKDVKGQWHWQLMASNGTEVALSARGYSRRALALQSGRSLFSGMGATVGYWTRTEYVRKPL